MNRVVVTGATSFLGRNFVNGLLDNGYEVYAMVRKTSPFLHLLPNSENLKLIYGSLDEIGVLKNVVQNAEVFVHFAWDGSGNKGRADETIQQHNVEYSMEALNVAIQLGCKMFIFPGSQAEYGKKFTLIKENEQCNPISEYGKAKIDFATLAEERCKNEKIQFVHLRIFSVYGYGDRSGTLVDTCIKKMNFGEVFQLGACAQRWNYLYIDDFVSVLIRLMESDCKSGIYNVASCDTRCLKEFVECIYQLSNKSGKYILGEIESNPEGSPSLDPSIDKMISVIGEYKFVDFKDGIMRVMEKMGV